MVQGGKSCRDAGRNAILFMGHGTVWKKLAEAVVMRSRGHAGLDEPHITDILIPNFKLCLEHYNGNYSKKQE